jgi:2-polyprenyl-3-methyl-5-hydroxy-6-metoxy-1,4-benzoquinol methylase
MRPLLAQPPAAGAHQPSGNHAAWRQVVDLASERYRAAGRFAFGFARAKLTHDPVFEHIVRHGLVAPRARVLDIGCGQGLLGSVLEAARELAHAGRWPREWGAAPLDARLTGIELVARDAMRARMALGERASIVCGDLRTTAFAPSDVVVLLDVLQYVDRAAQDDVLARARAALPAGGTLLMRVADASHRASFAWTRAVDRLVMRWRGGRWTRLEGRPASAWKERLCTLGFHPVGATRLARGGFANVLLVAQVTD